MLFGIPGLGRSTLLGKPSRKKSSPRSTVVVAAGVVGGVEGGERDDSDAVSDDDEDHVLDVEGWSALVVIAVGSGSGRPGSVSRPGPDGGTSPVDAVAVCCWRCGKRSYTVCKLGPLI